MIGIKVFRRRFVCGCSGTAAIEFALTAPIFLFLIIAIIECAMMYVVQNALDAAAREAGRLGMTGGTTSGSSREVAIQNKVISVVNAYSAGIVNTSSPDFSIEVKSYSALENVGQPEPYTDIAGLGYYVLGDPYVDVNGNGQWDEDQGTTGSFGIGGQVVNYTISYQWHSFLSGFGVPAIITLKGSTPVLNESF